MEQFELDAYKGLNDLYSVVNNSQLQKTLVGSPGGSRRDMSQDATGWGVENLSKYLLDNNGDPYGVLDPNAVKSFLDPINARNAALEERKSPFYNGYNWGVETEPSRVFSNFNTTQLQAYLDRLKSDAMAAGNPDNDAMWLPRLEGNNVLWGAKNGSKGGFLDAIDKYMPAVISAAFGGMAGLAGTGGGLGAAEEIAALTGSGTAAGAGLEGSLAGILDAPWGVNQQGGSMDWYDEFLNSIGIDPGSTQFAGGNSVYDLTGGVLNDYGSFAMNELGAGPAGTNLQDIITKIDSLPAGSGTAAKSLLSKLIGGQASQSDLMSLLGILGSTGLGILGSNQQSNSLEKIAAQSRADRAPFLNAATSWMNNPASYYASAPAQEAMKGVLHGLSVNGNPAANPTAMGLAAEAGLRDWRNAVTGFGNLGLSGQDSRNQVLSNAAAADRGVTTSLASGLGSLTQPQNSLQDLMKLLNMQGL